MSYFDVYKTRMNVLGSTKKENDINNERRIIDKYFNNSPSVFIVKINDIEKEVNIVSGNTLRNKEYLREVITKPEDSINVGDIVTWDNSNWLCTKNRDFYGIYQKGLIQKTNHTLKWLDSQHQLQQSPCIVTNQSGDINEEKYFLLPDGKYNVILPSTSTTQQIVRDKRFIFNKNAWRTIFVDHMTSGLITLIVEEDEIKDIDDLEQEIADVINVEYTVEILNNDANMLINNTLQLNISAKVDNIEVESPDLIFESNNENVAIVNENGSITAIAEGNCSIVVYYQNVSDSINIVVSDIIEDDYSLTITGSSSIQIGTTKIYICKIYNNGVEVEQSVTFSLSNELCSIESQDGNSCTIKAGSTTGIIDLIATLDNDQTVQKIRSIEITSLW